MDWAWRRRVRFIASSEWRVLRKLVEPVWVPPDWHYAETARNHDLRLVRLPSAEGRLFIPPLGTRNRRITGNLGRYALDLGRGYLIHGTTDQASIGAASTHGCIRVADDNLLWLFDNIPVGTRVVVR